MFVQGSSVWHEHLMSKLSFAKHNVEDGERDGQSVTPMLISTHMCQFILHGMFRLNFTVIIGVEHDLSDSLIFLEGGTVHLYPSLSLFYS